MPLTADEEVDLGQDYREPGVTAPQVTAAVQTPVAPPGAAPIAPPRPSPFLSPEEAANREQMRRVQYQTADLPLAQAEQAVATAMKFQAIRGYQRDLANGMPAAEALAKHAPMMFAQPKAGTLGQAASMVRASRPAPEKYMDIGGVGYQMTGGKAIPLTAPKPVKEKTVPLVIPADPENPLTGGHVTVQLAPDDPLVKKTLERARTGPPAPPPEPPGLFERIFGGGKAAVPAPAELPGKPVTPQQKVDAAKALRKLHPDWTKKQILDAVNQ